MDLNFLSSRPSTEQAQPSAFQLIARSITVFKSPWSFIWTQNTQIKNRLFALFASFLHVTVINFHNKCMEYLQWKYILLTLKNTKIFKHKNKVHKTAQTHSPPSLKCVKGAYSLIGMDAICSYTISPPGGSRTIRMADDMHDVLPRWYDWVI